MNEANSPVMAPTGERMVPESAHVGTFWEHVYRYRFAAGFVKGKSVLDIASGEGYGTAALRAAGAKDVVGVDISEEACRHAREKYGIDARPGTADAIPLEDASVDVVVSFETIEHVPSPANFLAECGRVLRPGGTLVLSTPLRETYGSSDPNEYHISEMTEAESVDLLKKRFENVRLWAQRPYTIAAWGAGATGADGVGTRVRKTWDNFWARVAVRSGRSGKLYASEAWRDRPTEAIGSTVGNGLPLNPYKVRPRDRFGLLGPQYLIVVATNPAR